MSSKVLLIFVLLQFNFLLLSQQLLYKSDNTFKPQWPVNYSQEYNEKTKIPEHLNEIAKNILKNRTGKHAKNMKVLSCTVINLSQYFKDFPDSTYNNFIPAKYFQISWSNKELGVDKHVFAMMLDSYN